MGNSIVKNNKPVIVIATDASISSFQAGLATMAGVSKDGCYFVKSRYVENVNNAEIFAIYDAYNAFRKPSKHSIEVWTDSQSAIDVIQNNSSIYDKHKKKLPNVIKRLHLAWKSGDLNLKKVEGHSENSLNDTADRIAVRHRRALQLELNEEDQHTVYSFIIEENLKVRSKNVFREND